MLPASPQGYPGATELNKPKQLLAEATTFQPATQRHSNIIVLIGMHTKLQSEGHLVHYLLHANDVSATYSTALVRSLTNRACSLMRAQLFNCYSKDDGESIQHASTDAVCGPASSLFCLRRRAAHYQTLQ